MLYDEAPELAKAIEWWSGKRRALGALLAHDETEATTDKFLKVHEVVVALEAAAGVSDANSTRDWLDDSVPPA